MTPGFAPGVLRSRRRGGQSGAGTARSMHGDGEKRRVPTGLTPQRMTASRVSTAWARRLRSTSWMRARWIAPLRTLRRYAAASGQHAERVHIGLEDGLVLAALVGVQLAQTHDRAQRLGVEAVGLGLRIDVAH